MGAVAVAGCPGAQLLTAAAVEQDVKEKGVHVAALPTVKDMTERSDDRTLFFPFPLHTCCGFRRRCCRLCVCVVLRRVQSAAPTAVVDVVQVLVGADLDCGRKMEGSCTRCLLLDYGWTDISAKTGSFSLLVPARTHE